MKRVTDDNLSSDEDAVLRRLHWFERYGVELSPERRALLTSIRARDKRTLIREPPDVLVEEEVEPEAGPDDQDDYVDPLEQPGS